MTFNAVWSASSTAESDFGAASVKTCMPKPELTEYSEMMGKARGAATDRMVARAAEMGADAIINVRYMTTSVVGSAAELLVYGTAVKLSE